MRGSVTALLTVFVLAWTDAIGQPPRAPVWVPQAPPFGTIGTLARLPDLRAILPTAESPVTDVRVAEWSPLGRVPRRFLRLLQVDGVIRPTVILWWFGGLGPAEPPLSAARVCTTSAESGTSCIQPLVARDEAQDWEVLLRILMAAQPCPRNRPTDGFELRLQVYESKAHLYREVEVCDPVAEDLRKRFDAVEFPP